MALKLLTSIEWLFKVQGKDCGFEVIKGLIMYEQAKKKKKNRAIREVPTKNQLHDILVYKANHWLTCGLL